MAQKINCLVYICVIAIQAGLFCVPPTMLEDEVIFWKQKDAGGFPSFFFQSGKIAVSIYLSNWYEKISKRLCMGVGFMMVRSQSSVEFNAGGLFPMNVQCLTTVCRQSSIRVLFKKFDCRFWMQGFPSIPWWKIESTREF